MTQKIINIGTVADDGTGDTLRGAFANTNNNFTELYIAVNSAFNYANAIALSNGDPGLAFTQANIAYTLANAAFNKANSANVLAFQTGIGANAWANSIVSDACNYITTVESDLNSSFADLSVGANTYAGLVGNSVNVSSRIYANSIGNNSNSYANIVGAASNSWSNTQTTSINTQESGYVLAATDIGKVIVANGANVYVTSGVFSAGQNIFIYNNTASSITVSQNTGVVIYSNGNSTGHRTLSTRGYAKLTCLFTNTFVISGTGIT